MPPGTGRFRLDELSDGGAGVPEQVELLGVARTLEWLAADDEVIPHTGFADRVMAVIATEPSPRPVLAAIGAARARRPLAALSALADLWRVAWTGGRPLAVRAPAMALVSLLLLGSIAVGALGAGATLSVLGLRAEPSAVASPPASLNALPPTSVAPSQADRASYEPSGEPSASSTPAPSTDDGSEGSSPAVATDDPGGGGPAPVSTPRPTPRETEHASQTHTPRPSRPPWHSHSPWPTESEHHSHTPTPTVTPTPTGTPSD